MEYVVPVDDETVSEIVRKSLEEMLEINFRGDLDDIETQTLVVSMLFVHDYYSTREQRLSFLEEFEDEIRELNSTLVVEDDDVSGIYNVETETADDGSLTISFDASPDVVESLQSKGMEYAIIRSILGDPTAEELIRWAERGKQEENTDDILRRFNEAKAESEIE